MSDDFRFERSTSKPAEPKPQAGSELTFKQWLQALFWTATLRPFLQSLFPKIESVDAEHAAMYYGYYTRLPSLRVQRKKWKKLTYFFSVRTEYDTSQRKLASIRGRAIHYYVIVAGIVAVIFAVAFLVLAVL